MMQKFELKIGIFCIESDAEKQFTKGFLAGNISLHFSEKKIIPQVGDVFSILNSDMNLIGSKGISQLVKVKYRIISFGFYDYGVFCENLNDLVA